MLGIKKFYSENEQNMWQVEKHFTNVFSLGVSSECC